MHAISTRIERYWFVLHFASLEQNYLPEKLAVSSILNSEGLQHSMQHSLILLQSYNWDISYCTSNAKKKFLMIFFKNYLSNLYMTKISLNKKSHLACFLHAILITKIKFFVRFFIFSLFCFKNQYLKLNRSFVLLTA